MNPILRNMLGLVIGWIGGSVANMGLIELGYKLMPIQGVDASDMEAYVEVLPTLEPKFFLFPFLAHAVGSLVGASIAGLIAVNNKMKYALGLGAFFFLGGAIINYMLPGPTWFTIVDLVFAYFPMAWIGGKVAENRATMTV